MLDVSGVAVEMCHREAELGPELLAASDLPDFFLQEALDGHDGNVRAASIEVRVTLKAQARAEKKALKDKEATAEGGEEKAAASPAAAAAAAPAAAAGPSKPAASKGKRPAAAAAADAAAAAAAAPPAKRGRGRPKKQQ